MFCPKCGSFICLPEDKCTMCGYIKKSNKKSKNKKQKNNTKNKRKYNPSFRLGGKTRFWNQKSFREYEVLGNSYSTYYF